MTRIAILPYGPSESVTILSNGINALYSSANPARKLLREGSRFRGRVDDTLINWGNSNVEDNYWEGLVGSSVNVLNTPESVRNASLKTRSMELFNSCGVSSVESTTDRDTASLWLSEGHGVYARTRLQGHSGEGIVYCYGSEHELSPEVGAIEQIESNTAPLAPLYTKAIAGPRREFRVHVFKGKVIFTQLKKRRANYRNDPEINYSDIVRNYHTGWIYASAPSTSVCNDKGYREAIKAVEALGLDFGAVDVITNQQDAWVLEVNTAPGQSGITTHSRYIEAFKNFHDGVDTVEHLPEGVDFRTVEATEASLDDIVAEVLATPAPRPVTPVPVGTAEPGMGPNTPVPPVDDQTDSSLVTSLIGTIASSPLITEQDSFCPSELTLLVASAFLAQRHDTGMFNHITTDEAFLSRVSELCEDDVDHAFTWSNTWQGSDFWNVVYTAIDENINSCFTEIYAPAAGNAMLQTVCENSGYIIGSEFYDHFGLTAPVHVLDRYRGEIAEDATHYHIANVNSNLNGKWYKMVGDNLMWFAEASRAWRRSRADLRSDSFAEIPARFLPGNNQPEVVMTADADVTMVDQGLYNLTLDGDPVVGQYRESRNDFELIGYDVPMNRDQVVITGHIA